MGVDNMQQLVASSPKSVAQPQSRAFGADISLNILNSANIQAPLDEEMDIRSSNFNQAKYPILGKGSAREKRRIETRQNVKF